MSNTLDETSVRFTVSIHPDLLRRFDKSVAKTPHKNRSHAVTDLIRNRIVEEDTAVPNTEVMGTLTILYDHHHRRLQSTLTSLQHDHHHSIVSTVHVHMDHDNCLEVLVVRGRHHALAELAAQVGAIKGIKHSKLSVTETGKNLPS